MSTRQHELTFKITADGKQASAEIRRFAQLLLSTVTSIDRTEQARTQRARAADRADEESSRATIRRREQEATAAERVARERIRSLGLEAREQERTAVTVVRATGAADRERIRTSTLAAREFEKLEREKLKTAQATARAAAKEYEGQLGRGFFSKLARAATASFREGFKVGGESFGGGTGGGGLLSGALSVAGGNLLTGALSTVAGALKDKITRGFDLLDLQERSLKAFEVLNRNAGESAERAAEKARAHIAELLEAKDLRRAFGTGPLFELSQQLQAVGFHAEEVIPSLRAVGNAVSVYKDAPERLQRIFLQLSQLKTTQQVSGEELRVLAENGVPAWRYLSEYAGKSVAQVRKLAQKGMLDAEVAVKVILGGMEKDFGGMMKSTADSYSRMWNTIEELSTERAAQAFEPAFQQVKRGQRAAIAGLESSAAEGFSKGAAGVQNILVGAFDKILAGLATGDFKELGFGAVESVVTGAKEGAKGLYDAGTKAGDQLEQGWRDRMQQRSPSQVMLNLGFEAGKSLLTGFLKGAQSSETMDRIEQAIQEAAKKFKVDPELIRAVIKKESSFRPGAISPMGAQGLMQLMPGTAARYGVRNPFNIEQNIMGGTAYLAELIKEFKDLRLALAAYNAGEGAVRANLPNRPDVNSYIGGSGRRWTVSELTAQRSQGIPNNGQTPEYVDTVMRYYRQFTGGGASSGGAVPVVITNLRPFEETVRGFPGHPVDAEAERRAQGSNEPRPNPDDLTGGVGRFAGPGNQQGFLLWLYDLNKSFAERGSTTVAAQADYQHKISLMATELNVTTNFVRMAQGFVAERLELERKARDEAARAAGLAGGTTAAGAAELPPAQKLGFDVNKFLVPSQVMEPSLKSATQAQYELLKAIHGTGDEAEKEYGKAGQSTDNYGSLVKKTVGILGDLKKAKEELETETDFSATELAAQTLGESFRSLKENMLESVDAIIFSGASLKEALAESFKNTLAQTAAFLGKKAMLKGLEETAEALSSLAVGDFRGFAQHGAAAAGWFALAAAASIGGRVIAGNGKKGAGVGGGASSGQENAEQRDTSGQDRFTRDTRFLYGADRQVQGHGLMGNVIAPLINSIEAMDRRDDMRTQMIVASNNRVAGVLGTFETAHPEDIVRKAHERDPEMAMYHVRQGVNRDPTELADILKPLFR